jgi:hypothetical protein
LTTELEDGITYYGANTHGDCKLLSILVTVGVYDQIIPPIVTTPVELCVTTNNLTLSDLSYYVSGNDLQWYGSQYSSDALPMSTPLVSGATYWVSQGTGTCESARSYVTVVLNTHLNIPAPELNSPIELCETLAGAITLDELPTGNLHLQWYAADGETRLDGDMIITGDGTYYAALVAGECESSDKTTVVVTFAPVIHSEPNIEGPLYFCNQTTIAALNIPNVVWYYNASDVTALPTTHVLETHTYYVALTIGDCESTNKVAVEVVIEPVDYEYPAIEANFCAGSTLGDVPVTGYGITWYSEAELLNELPLTAELEEGVTYYAASTFGACKLISMSVTTHIYNNLLPPVVTTPVELCVTANNLTLSDLSYYVSGNDLQWYGSQYGNDALPVNTPLVSGSTYWVSQGSGVCESARSYVTVVLNAHLNIPAPAIASPIDLCETLAGSITLEELTNLHVQWYAADGETPLEGNAVITGAATYYAALIAGECEGSEKTAVEVTFAPEIHSVPDIASQLYYCENTTIGNLNISHVSWYYNIGDVTALPSNHVLETHTYYVAVSIGECESTERVAVNVTINPGDYDFAADAQGFCIGATLADIAVSGYGITWFADAGMTEALPITTELEDGVTYYAANTLNNCLIKI